MKKIYFFLITCLFLAFNLQGQDLAVADILITSDTNNNAPIGVETSVEVVVQNLDSISLPAGDTFSLSATANGETLVLTHVLQNDLDSGVSLSLNFGPEQLVLIDTFSNFQVIAAVDYSMDIDTLNNALAEDFIPSPFVDNDWSCSNVSIIAPAWLDTIDLDNNTNLPPAIEAINIKLTNEGVVHYLPYSSIHYRIFLGADTSDLNVYLGETSVNPGETTLRSLSNQNLIPLIPDSVGIYALCGQSVQPIDANPLNDNFCISIPVVDNFDPTDPFNWPTGQEEEKIAFDPYNLQWNGSITTILANQALTYRLYNALGGQLEAGSLNAGSQKGFQNLASGVYLLQVEGSDVPPTTEKFVVR